REQPTGALYAVNCPPARSSVCFSPRRSFGCSGSRLARGWPGHVSTADHRTFGASMLAALVALPALRIRWATARSVASGAANRALVPTRIRGHGAGPCNAQDLTVRAAAGGDQGIGHLGGSLWRRRLPEDDRGPGLPTTSRIFQWHLRD